MAPAFQLHELTGLSLIHKVHFLSEDTIIESIQNTIKAKLVGANSSRTFTVSSTVQCLPVCSCRAATCTSS
jgi:hypothetical protein